MRKHPAKRFVALLLLVTMLMSVCGVSMAEAGMQFYRNRDGYYAEYHYVNEDLKVNPKLENFSNSLINNVKLAVYCMNAFEEPIYPYDEETGYIRYFESPKGYAGGRVGPFGDCLMKGCANAAIVGVAIVGFTYRDGPTIDVGDPNETDPLKKYEWVYWGF